MSSLKRRKDEKQRDFKNKNEQQTVTPDPTRPIHVENTTRPSSPRLLIIASCFLLHPSSSCPKPKASVIIAKKSTLSAFNMASTDSEEAQSVNKQYEENIAAQRSAAEAIAISRATLEATMGQGEQLQNCEKLQERNKYVVQKSGRMVRGMTWSGWMMNVFSKDVEPPMDRAASDAMKQSSSSDDAVSHILGDSDVKDVPEELENPARMLQNYECNVILLEKCQTRQEFNTLLEICKSLNTSARRSLMDREGPGRLSGRSFQLLRKLEKRFEQVEDLQFSTVQKLTEKFQGETQANVQTQRRDDSLRSSSSKPTCNPSKERLWAKTNDTTLKHRIEKQDEHLDILAGNIQELLHNGASIGTSLEQQNRLLEKLDAGTEDLTEQTKMVTRRADRLSHRSLWRSPKSDYKFSVSIQHIITNKYLSIEPKRKNRIALHDDLHPDLSIFEVHERRGSSLIGFMNKCSRTWLGQSGLGYIVCNAKKFGQKEEWEIDDSDDMTITKILCASAHWGNGGWLQVDEANEAFSVGDYDADAKNKASMWSIVILDDNK